MPEFEMMFIGFYDVYAALVITEDFLFMTIVPATSAIQFNRQCIRAFLIPFDLIPSTFRFSLRRAFNLSTDVRLL